MAHIDQMKAWHTAFVGESAAFMSVEPQFAPALLTGDPDVALPVVRHMDQTARPLLHWLYDNPCPDTDVNGHFAGILGGYVQICEEILNDAETLGISSEARVDQLLAEIKAHEAELDRWQP